MELKFGMRVVEPKETIYGTWYLREKRGPCNRWWDGERWDERFWYARLYDTQKEAHDALRGAAETE